jgi:hypothetical protein
LTNAELVQLRSRVIALENLVIALLADDLIGSLTLLAKWQPSPRPGFTHHPLTIRAAAHMIDLVERAGHFRVVRIFMSASPTPVPYKRTSVFDENTLPAGTAPWASSECSKADCVIKYSTRPPR